MNQHGPDKKSAALEYPGLARVFIGAYELANRAGLLRSPTFVKRVFVPAYFTYKKYYEDAFAGLVKKHPEFFRGGHILDLGSNIGYTACVFGRVVDKPYQVYAFEPDPTNFAILSEAVKRQGLSEKVQAEPAAVGESRGKLKLWINSSHHGDHRIYTDTFKSWGMDSGSTIEVDVWSVDEYLHEHQINGPISFIKIDVQGFENPVCRGLIKTLEKNPGASLAIEYGPSYLKAQGFDPNELLEFFESRHYQFWQITHQGDLQPVNREQINQIASRDDYLDILCRQSSL